MKRHIYVGRTRRFWCGAELRARKRLLCAITEDEFDRKVISYSGVCKSCQRSLIVSRRDDRGAEN